uniref:Uncharacterized protein n=1 Tax=Myotis myotis TaxID=51298 RepID=A0A7J7R501_MYOMY|nr:hypothetical protein mMyoMyo1_010899 [Myotis myotis]
MPGPRHLPSPLRESEVPLPHVLPPGVQNSVLPRCDLQPCYPTRPCRASCPRGPPQAVPLLQRGCGGQAWCRGSHRSLGVWLLLVSRGGAVLPMPLPTSVGSKQATRRETSVTLYFQQVSGCWGHGESEQASASHPPRGDVQGQELARGCWMPSAMGRGGVAQSRQAWAGPSGTPGPPGERSGHVQ